MKRIIIISIYAILIASALVIGYFIMRFDPAEKVEFGLNFSILHVQQLGFDWKEAYLDMLNDLNPKYLRLMTYWELLEQNQGQFRFQEVDEMLIEAGKRNIDVILVVGHKQPRWPECHHPQWYETLDTQEQNQALLNFVEQTVKHFRQYQAIKIWQVENEPFFQFGHNCSKSDPEVLKREVELVKSLDSRPVMLTDSGEQGNWLKTAKHGADKFGSTMYRKVYSPRFGYYQYPWPPQFFQMKAGWLISYTQLNSQDIVGVELQAEPWFIQDIGETPLKTQFSLMNPIVLAEHADYASKAGFSRNYLWGVEWWYWLSQKHNDWGMWDQAKALINN